MRNINCIRIVVCNFAHLQVSLTWCVGNADASGWFVNAVSSLHLNRATLLNRQRWTLNMCLEYSRVSHYNVGKTVVIKCLITLECEPTLKPHLSFDSLNSVCKWQMDYHIACELF